MLGRAWRAPAVTSHVQPASVSRVVSIKTNRYQSHTHTHTHSPPATPACLLSMPFYTPINTILLVVVLV